MATKMTAQQARDLLKRATKVAVASGPIGACYVMRGGRTDDICAQLSESECKFVDTELRALGAGFADFFAGKQCKA